MKTERVTDPAPALGVLVHALHYGLVLGGLVMIGTLLFASSPLHARDSRGPLDEHEQRVDALKTAAEAGMLGTQTMSPAATLTRDAVMAGREVPTAAVPVLVAVVSSTAAAGVHAAAGPAHFGEGVLVGGFFVLAALVQLGWAVRAALGTPSAAVWWTGLVFNAAVIALWTLTRTLGLPWGLAGVEAAGAWDVAATAWEAAVVVGCAWALSSSRPVAVDAMTRWPGVARAWLVGSVLLLLVLSLAATPS